MTLFLILTALALILAVASVITPLLAQSTEPKQPTLAIVAMVSVPMALLGLYLIVGQPQAIDRDLTPADELRAQLIEVANALERDPDNQNNWLALGIAYKNIEAFSAAEHALRRALYVDDTNPTAQVELAEALIFAGAGTIPDEAGLLLDQALASDPMNQKAIWLKGVVAFGAERFGEAIVAWQALLDVIDEQAPIRASIERQIELAQQRLEPERRGRYIDLTLEIAPAFLAELTGDETLFVIAQAVDGPPTPLAARRLVVADLPTTIRLSDQDAMIDGLTLSQFGEIKLTARVSLGGDVTPQAGDLQGQATVGPSTRATIVINDRLADGA